MKTAATVKAYSKFARLLSFSCVAVLAGIVVGLPQEAGQSGSEAFLRRPDAAIPMRDGVVLRADILLPKAEGRSPALIYRTPYGKHFALKEYKTFERAVARGYAVLIQDVRGRYA